MARAAPAAGPVSGRTVNYIDQVFDGLLGGLVERVFVSHQASTKITGFHTHPGEQVVVGLEGEGIVEVERRGGRRAAWPFREGDVLVVAGGQPHRWIVPGGELTALALNCCTPGAAPRNAPPLDEEFGRVTAMLLGGGASEVYPALVKNDAEWRRQVEQYAAEAQTRRPGARIRAGALALEMLVHLARRCLAAGAVGAGCEGAGVPRERIAPRHYVERAREYLHAHYRQPLALEDVAAAVGLSVTHLHRLFVAQLQLPPMAYLRRYRLRRAAELLAQSDRPIGQIARELAFGSPARFAKAFRKEFGRSPREHRVEALRARPGEL